MEEICLMGGSGGCRVGREEGWNNLVGGVGCMGGIAGEGVLLCEPEIH